MKVIGRLAKYASIVAVVFAVAGLATRITNSQTITRSDLGVQSIDEKSCPKSELPFRLTPLVSEQAAVDYFIFALASRTVYQNPEDKVFNFKTFPDSGFTPFDLSTKDWLSNSPSHYFEVYTKRRETDPQVIDVIVAFRGTRGFFYLDDWVSNFSWFTGFLPVENNYDAARSSFMNLRQELAESFPQSNFSYVVTGHSLGGGIAQHVADSFPCVSAVVFDTSFVTNTFKLNEPFSEHKTVSIYEKGDELTHLRDTIFGPQVDTCTYRWYPINVRDCGRWGLFFCENFQHNLRDHAVGLSRMVADCRQNRNCSPEFNGPNPKADIIWEYYCNTYANKDGPNNDPDVCAKIWDNMKGEATY